MKRTYLRFLSQGLAVLITAVFLISGTEATAASASRAKPELPELNMGLPDLDPSFLPNWAAEQKGFFKEEGFNSVKIMVFQGGAPMVQALASGTIDLCLTSLAVVVNSITAGQKFKAVWAGYNMSGFGWYGLPKYKSIGETKGGRYAVSRFGSLTDFLTRYALRKAGLDPEKDVKILQLGGQSQFLAAMASGQVDVAILSPPNTYTAVEKGFIRLMTQKDLSRDYPTHVVLTKEQFIAKNPNTIKAYLRATTRAMEWIKANREEAIALLNKQLKFSLDHSRKAVDDLKDDWYPDGRLPQEGMKVFWAITVESGDAKEPWQESKWLDDTFLRTQNEWRK